MIVTAILGVAAGFRLNAQEASQDSLRVAVFFPQGDETVYYSYKDNKVALEAVREVLRHSPSARVVVRTVTSAEGSASRNRELVRQRANVMRDYLETICGLAPEQIETVPAGIDYDTLREIVRSLDMPWRDRVLDVMERYPYPKWQLKALDDGEPWQYLLTHVFWQLRRADVLVILPNGEPAGHEVSAEVGDPEMLPADLPVEPAPVSPSYVTSTGFAVRTNVLAIPLANIGVEIPLGGHWSLGVDWYYPWLWRSHGSEGVDYNGKCVQILAGGLDSRYWFGGSSRLVGPALGVFGTAGYYDLEWDFHGYQGEFASAGVEFVYACPVFRDKMRLEFNLGLGYFYSRAREYQTYWEGGKAYMEKDMAKDVHFVGPVKGGMSLVVPIRVKKRVK